MKGLSKAFKKLKNSEKLLQEDTSSLANFIDGFITVTTNKQIVGEDVAMAVKEVNQHKHSKTCRKHGTKCRFNYPKPPSPHTIITQPVQESKLMKKKTAKDKSHRIINRVMQVLDDPDTVKKIMADYDKDNESKEETEVNRIKRIKKVCELAEVKYEEYFIRVSYEIQKPNIRNLKVPYKWV